MRDIFVSDLERLQPGAIEASETFQMDQDSFRAFYDRTARPLWVFLWRKTGDAQLADDLLQETYYRLLRTRMVFENEKHRKNYVFRIAANLAHDSRRRRKDQEELLEDDERAAAQGEPDPAERSQRREDLARAMAQLKPRQRDALWLAYAEGSSHAEIAEVLGLKANSVKLILFRARRKLAALLRGAAR
jgi:RNA polymerase sigma-70 factor (ECF subfamily)